jgi:hypothetical protein
MIHELKILFGISNRCNRCEQITEKKHRILDHLYLGFECIACATYSGLLEENQQRQASFELKLKHRKDFGL